MLLAIDLRRALDRLPAAQRTLLLDLYVRGRTGEEVAAQLGIPEGTVKSRAYYARRALRAAIERDGTAGRDHSADPAVP